MNFSKLLNEIDEDLNIKCFEFSVIAGILKELCHDKYAIIENRVVKKLLSQHYAEKLCFSQMFN